MPPSDLNQSPLVFGTSISTATLPQTWFAQKALAQVDHQGKIK